ncbi:MAG TPA: helix-turn-helix transcriptional regulator [Streptosporangiaceae bacterium]
MLEHPNAFGRELRRRRLETGLTLDRLAGLVHYSKAQLSKVERGISRPSRELVRLCDAVLDAGGALSAQAGTGSKPAGVHEVSDGEEVWLMGLSANGQSWFRPISRREAVAIGAASIAALGIGRPEIAFTAENASLIDTFGSLFDQYRMLGQSVDSGLLVPSLIAQTNTIRELSTSVRSQTRDSLLRLCSRYAEYIGWLVQEGGDDHAALWWTHQAVMLADSGDDHDLSAYALIRRALITLYRGDAEQTIRLARRAQVATLPPRIRGLAAQREAQGHALAGDHDACMRGLDRARKLLAADAQEPGSRVLGTSNLASPAEMITGWCLYDLGRPLAAAEVMDVQVAAIPRHAVRTRVRYGARRALAYASAGEVEHACRLTRDLLDDVITIGSATVALDMRRLSRTLSRHPRNAAVRELAPDLGAALRPTDS